MMMGRSKGGTFKGGASSSTRLSRQVILLGLCLSSFGLGALFGTRGLMQSTFADVTVVNPHGRILSDTDTSKNQSVIQPAKVGRTGNDFISTVQYQILSWYPRAVLYHGFADSHICDNIVKLAKRHLAPSGLALRKGETSASTKNIRTSSGTFLSSSQDSSGALAWVERKIAQVVHLPVAHGEAFNVLRYELGQKYDAHYDTFNPAEYGPQKSQRIATVLLYLTDVEEGGETMFPYEDRKFQAAYNYKDCVGLLVKPRKGDALLFYSVWPNKTFDLASLHGSCPVTKGEKWVATKWIRDEDALLSIHGKQT